MSNFLVHGTLHADTWISWSDITGPELLPWEGVCQMGYESTRFSGGRSTRSQPEGGGVEWNIYIGVGFGLPQLIQSSLSLLSLVNEYFID